MAAAEGITARGQAGILGSSMNPVQVYLQNTANRQRRADLIQQEEVKKRDSLIDDMRKFNPDKVWDPFYSEVNDFVQKNVKDHTNSLLDKGIPTSRVERDLSARKGEVNTLVAKANWLKQAHTDLSTRADKDEYLDPKYYHSKINNVFFNGMQAKPINEINTEGADNIFEDSKGYRTDKVVKDFMTGLPEKINEHYSQYWDKLGQNYNIQDTKTKLGLQYEVGPDGKLTDKVIIDPRTQQPKISMTDDVYTQALGNHYLMNIVKDNLGASATDAQKKDYLTGLLEGLDPAQIKNRPMVGHKMTNEDRWSIGGFSGRVNPANIVDRFENTDKVANGFHPEILANTFSPYEEQSVQYVDSNGKSVVSEKNGTYYDEKGVPTGKPTKIKVEFAGKANPMAIAAIAMSDLPAAEKQQAMSEAMAGNGKVPKTFDITTESGRRQWHEASNRILDQYLPMKDRYGEDYTKVVKEKYEKKAAVGASGVVWKKK